MFLIRFLPWTTLCILRIEFTLFIPQRYAESSVAVSMLQQKVPQDKEELQELKDEIRKAKADKAREEQRESENISPNPEGRRYNLALSALCAHSFPFEFFVRASCKECSLAHFKTVSLRSDWSVAVM